MSEELKNLLGAFLILYGFPSWIALFITLFMQKGWAWRAFFTGLVATVFLTGIFYLVDWGYFIGAPLLLPLISSVLYVVLFLCFKPRSAAN